jgi:hypothetical protein
VFLCGTIAEVAHNLLGQPHHINPLNPQIHLIFDHLAEVEQLIYEGEHTLGVLVREREAVGGSLGEFLVALHLLDTADDECQRGTQLV